MANHCQVKILPDYMRSHWVEPNQRVTLALMIAYFRLLIWKQNGEAKVNYRCDKYNYQDEIDTL
jgi:hypothetical protein